MLKPFKFVSAVIIYALASNNDAIANTLPVVTPFIIEAYGGSSTQGAMAVRENGKVHAIFIKDNEIGLLDDMLTAKYGEGIQIINKGVSSSQAIELLNAKYYYKKNKTWRDEMKASPAKIILLNFATNDARHFHFNDIAADYRVSPQRYNEVMTQLINIAREEGKEVVLQEPHPICGRAEKWGIAPYATQLDAISRSQSVPLVRQYKRILAIKDWQSLLSPDCIHPSRQLYRMKAEETFTVLVNHFDSQLAAAGQSGRRDVEQTVQR